MPKISKKKMVGMNGKPHTKKKCVKKKASRLPIPPVGSDVWVNDPDGGYDAELLQILVKTCRVETTDGKILIVPTKWISHHKPKNDTPITQPRFTVAGLDGDRKNGSDKTTCTEPHDELAEQCVLACFQLDNSLFHTIPLNSNQFSKPYNQTIFQVMLDLHNDGIPPDTVTVASALNDQNLLSDVGGWNYLEECLSATPHIHHAQYYADIVREKARLRELHRHCVSIDKACLSGGVDWKALNADILGLRDFIDSGASSDLKTTPLGKFIEENPTLKPPVIDGLIRQGETANIVAPSKAGKTWLSYDLALSIPSGRKWLDTFQTTQGRVLIIDNELHPPSIAKRIPTVAAAMKLRPEEYQDRIDIVSLRGQLKDFKGIGPLVRSIEEGKYVAIIVDAYYRMLPPGTSENDNSQIAAVYNLIDNYAAQTGAAWFLIHHSTKGSQSDKRATDVGAGAGSQSRAADCHVVLREHQEPGHVVMDADVRSFPPVKPAVLEWCFPIWRPAKNMDPGQLRTKKSLTEEIQKKKDSEGTQKIVEALASGPATIRSLCSQTGLSREVLNRLLGKLSINKKVVCTEVMVGGKPAKEYRTSEH